MTNDSSPLLPVIMRVPPSERYPRGRERVRALSRLARETARISACKSGITLADFPKDPDGVPMPAKGIFWSISHKTQYVAGVVSAHPVGIDIEKLRAVNDGLMEKIADEKEWGLVKDQTAHTFLRFWTAKEAVLKATGVGFTGLSNYRIDAILDDNNIIVTFGRQRFDIQQTWFSSNHLAAITATGRTVDWTII